MIKSKRHAVNKHSAASHFRSSSSKVHPKNVRVGLMRGGYRL